MRESRKVSSGWTTPSDGLLRIGEDRLSANDHAASEGQLSSPAMSQAEGATWS
jgi:hypothetical protein